MTAAARVPAPPQAAPKPRVRAKAGRGWTPAGAAAAGVTVIGCPTPFRLERVQCLGRPGQSVAEMIGQACGGRIDPDLLQFGRAFIGPERVDPKVWHRTYPKAGTVLSFRLIHEGGDALRIVLSVAIVAAAAWAGPLAAGAILGTTASAAATAGALGFGASLATFSAVSAAATLGIATLGSLALNMLIPRRPPSLAQSSPSPTYSYGGTRNVANKNGAVPIPLGRNRQAPNFVTKPFTELVGDDQYVRMHFTYGYGPVGRQDHKIGETLLTDFDDYDLEERDGLAGDAPLTLVTGLTNEEQFSHRLVEGDDWVVERTAPGVDEFTLQWIYAGGLFKVGANGKLKEASGVVAARYRPVGAVDWIPIGTFDVQEKKQEPFRKGTRVVPAGGRGQFDIGMRCTEDESQAKNIVWETLRSFTHQPAHSFPYPLAETVLRIKMTGQLSGVVDTFNCISTSRCLDWDTATGNWIERETSNPASLYRYILQHPGNEARIGDDEIDLPKLQEWHDYCRLRGLEFNQVRDFVAGVDQLLQDIAAAGHATPDWVDGLETVVIDQPSDLVVQALGPQNSWGFKIVKSDRSIPDAVMCRFVDAAGNYNTDAQRLVVRQGVDPLAVVNIETAEKPGVVHADQIWKDVQRDLLELQYRPVEYSVNVRWLDLICDRGDRIQVAHDFLRLPAGQTGRVMQTGGAGAVWWVRLDEPVTMEAGKLYAVRFTREDGSQNVRSVVCKPGETRLIRLFGPGDLPAAGEIFFFGEADRESKPLIVKSIERQGDFVARLVMVDMAPEIDAADSLVPPVWVPREPSPSDDSPATPKITSILSGDQAQVIGDDGTVLQPVIVGVGAGYGAPVPTDHFELQHRMKGSLSGWSSVTIPAAQTSAWLLTYAAADVIQLRLKAWGTTGKPSLWSPMIEYTVLSRTMQPPDVATFEVTRLASGTRHFVWSFADPDGTGLPPDLVGVQIRYGLGAGLPWASLNPLNTGPLGSSPWDTSEPGPAGTWTFGAVGQNRSGLVSANPKLITRALGPGIVAPAPTITTLPATIGNSNPAITGTAEPSAAIRVFVDGSQVATASADLVGNWSAQLADLVVGPRVITASQTVNGSSSGLSLPVVLTVTWDDPDMAVDVDFPRRRYRLGATQVDAAVSGWAGLFDIITSPAQLVVNADGTWSKIAANVLPLGVGLPLRTANANRTNRNTNYNAAPAAGVPVNLVKSGDAAATLNAVAGSFAGSVLAALAADGTLGGNVFELDNTLGTTDAFATPGGQALDTTSLHWGSAFVQGTSGRLETSTGTALATFAASTPWVRVSGSFTPTAVTNQIRIAAPPGKKVRFILNDLSVGLYLAAPIIIAGATATQAAPVIKRTTGAADWGTAEGVMGFRARQIAGSTANSVILQALSADAANYNVVQFVSPASARGGSLVGGTSQGFANVASLTITSTVQGLYGFKAADKGFAANGNLAAPVTSGTVPTGTPVVLQVGAGDLDIERLKWGKTKPANAVLQAKSAWTLP
jgi:hypothetical protein